MFPWEAWATFEQQECQSSPGRGSVILHTTSVRVQFPIRAHELYHHELLRTKIFCNFQRFLIRHPIGLSNHLKTLSNHYLDGVFIASSYAKQSFITAKFSIITNKVTSAIWRFEAGGDTFSQPAEDIKELWLPVGTVFNHLGCAQILPSSICTSPEVFYPSIISKY